MTKTIHVGFDIGASKLRCGLFDRDYQIIAHATDRTPTVSPGAADPDAVALSAMRLLKRLQAECHASATAIKTIGIGIAAQLADDGRRIGNAPNLGWRNVDFLGAWQNAADADPLTTPKLVNDVVAQTWAEYCRGAVRGVSDDVLAVYIGTGIGGALLANGRIVSGHSGLAGEIGHCKLAADGPTCGCGQRGCLEAYAGGRSLQQQLCERLRDDERLSATYMDANGLVDLAKVDQTHVNMPAFGELWRATAARVALVVANACTLCDPGAVLLGGGVISTCPALRSLIENGVRTLTPTGTQSSLRFLAPGLGELAGPMGAAMLATP